MLSIKNLDTELFLWLNHQNSAWADVFFWWVSKPLVWIPFYMFIIILLILKHKKRAIFYILTIIATIGLSDFIASGIIKPFVKRLRPTHEPAIQELVRTLHDYRGGEYGMASSHAANTFAFSMIIWLFFRNEKSGFTKFLPLLFVWSILVSYSRIYLGVHYPSDILVGAFIGIGCAILLKKIVDYLATF